MTYIVCEKGLHDMGKCRNNDDIQDELVLFFQQREYEMFLACDFNLTSFTAVDVLKMVIELDGSTTKAQIGQILGLVNDFIMDKPELCLDLITSFEQVPLYMAVTLVVCNQLELSKLSQHLLGLIIQK